VLPIAIGKTALPLLCRAYFALRTAKVSGNLISAKS
jgi:hypothetical protein